MLYSAQPQISDTNRRETNFGPIAFHVEHVEATHWKLQNSAFNVTMMSLRAHVALSGGDSNCHE